MNRSQLVEEIADTTGLTKRQAEEAVDAFVFTIGDQVRSGSKVTIYGFGSFNPTSRKARTGRNPRTGQPVKIAASKGIRFSPATGFKADLNAKKSAAKKAAAAKASPGRRRGPCGTGEGREGHESDHDYGRQGDRAEVCGGGEECAVAWTWPACQSQRQDRRSQDGRREEDCPSKGAR